ncbi:hypothetical protein X777_12162 [Ooceraea biroi]|uniref:Uncharacterized protein n=1 Tax=Ooceraea biroi TaxID=2015173 RepID=A0A026W0N0_OOCBI|nr:hypothetical protein X777_12162 [Ooceraea biroi]
MRRAEELKDIQERCDTFLNSCMPGSVLHNKVVERVVYRYYRRASWNVFPWTVLRFVFGKDRGAKDHRISRGRSSGSSEDVRGKKGEFSFRCRNWNCRWRPDLRHFAIAVAVASRVGRPRFCGARQKGGRGKGLRSLACLLVVFLRSAVCFVGQC